MPTHRLLAPVLVTLMLAVPALAQQAGNPNPAPAQPTWIALVISIVLIIGVCVASFMNSKRGHQD